MTLKIIGGFRIIDFEDIDKGIPYDFINEPSEHNQTFKIGLNPDAVRGIYYNTSSQSYVFLKFQESTFDVMKTCDHESMHAAVDHCSTWEDDEIDDDTLEEEWAFYVDDDQEHWAIQKINWIDDII